MNNDPLVVMDCMVCVDGRSEIDLELQLIPASLENNTVPMLPPAMAKLPDVATEWRGVPLE